MSGPSSTTASPTISASTPPSSIPSPETNKLNLPESAVSEEDRLEATNLKAQANKSFTSITIYTSCVGFEWRLVGHDFPAAARLYSEAIEKNPRDAILWSNRAYTRIKLEEFGYALADASRFRRNPSSRSTLNLLGQAIALDPRYAKAYYR